MTAPDVRLRAVEDADLPVFFGHLQDPEAIRMAAFTPADPSDGDAFAARWQRIRTHPTGIVRTILADGQVAGHVASYESGGDTEVTYWLGREHWGRGVATLALRAFLTEVTLRPLRARAVQDNAASLRVLQRCGFRVCGQDRGFANGRGAEVAEFVLVLDE
ncbi:Protein N-acetyltransferase, RimJ/RimL family [Actinopolymorpha cephalotaxi]|uniref:Protein N-acetyltransferase, RimJ/RimL family n=1 Tax=Actinopolymorpha cephalotaxi TaxID=504797 RepID=A0A1I2TM29_9ACTN|nr:GNAT family N-acetyltransferase [Actinopolymorpha cephalotaxi]NYH83055.1 RimJ/RimL family protein N-acetyltransferase [Actinopolymorpha cephalotaxi]SFG63381.1 Protein N-acetyltransferase, RimJ/RimL family [Actinopolymorpha cephalotaxi]